MEHVLKFILLYFVGVVKCEWDNVTEPASLQLLEFRHHHPRPIGILTTKQGAPVDIRDTVAINSDVINNEALLESIIQTDSERIPERAVHAKGAGAFGYFEVTHDVSKYTSADVFNEIGKKTPVVGRFSTAIQNLGGNDLNRELKGLAVKFYTKEGNLDFLCIHTPAYFYSEPYDFANFVHSLKRNPKTDLFDFNSYWDFSTKRPSTSFANLFLFSDYGLPDGYRKMDNFPIHTYELNNKHGDRFYVRFNFRTEQGLANLTDAQATQIADPDYYKRDLYNAIEEGNFPSWRLEMYVMSLDDIKHSEYDPFLTTRDWKKGTYKVVNIGRLVFNKNPENFFRDVEQSAFFPGNLVPGIPGPVDFMFKTRRISYRDTQNHRVGRNHEKIKVNKPLHVTNYVRDGPPPVDDNMKEAPNYYPNSFNGPIPYVDESRPKEKLIILESNAVDLQPAADFYTENVKGEAHKRRLTSNIATTLERVYPEIIERVVRLFSFINPDLGKRLKREIENRMEINAASMTTTPRPRRSKHMANK